MNQTHAGGTIDIFGFALGGPYADASSAAKGKVELKEKGDEWHQGTGTLVGESATVNLQGEGGRLVDIKIQISLAKGDQSMAGSAPLTTLEAALGSPAEKSADVVTWRPAGAEVTLQRAQSYSRGVDTPKVQYDIRARLKQQPARTGPDERDEASKEREADEASP